MIELPHSTVYGKRMPKEKFYAHLQLAPALKRSFVEDVDYFVWQHKLASSTLNIEAGERVKEIAIFHVYLKSARYNPAIFKLIDKSVPVYVLYVLHYEEKAQLLLSYKQAHASKAVAFKVLETFVSDWFTEADISLSLEGLNLDAIYENFVRQVAGEKLPQIATGSMEDDIAEWQRRAKLERKIVRLQAQMRKENQYNKQIAISAEIKELKNSL